MQILNHLSDIANTIEATTALLGVLWLMYRGVRRDRRDDDR